MELIKLKESEEQKLLEMKREVERQVEEERMRLVQEEESWARHQAELRRSQQADPEEEKTF